MGFSHAFDGSVVGDAGIVDEDVDVSEFLECVGNKVEGALFVGDVNRVSFSFDPEGSELLFDGFHLRAAGSTTEGDVASFLSKADGDGTPDAASCASDDCYFVF